MSLFEFTFALSAVILGLALTHIAATIHKLLLAGKRVKWALEPVLLTSIVLLVIVSVWLAAWSDREAATVTIGQMLLQVAKLLTLYIAAASCLPEPSGAEPESGLVHAIGVVLSKGRKIATAEAKLYTADGTLVAHGSSTLMILSDATWSTQH